MQQRVDLGKAVLKGVSRSFYLTIRLLPRLMREPVSVGYLLARASDTIADTESVPAEVRNECLSLFYKALKDEDAREQLSNLLAEKFIESQENKKEQVLLKNLEDVFGWYDSVRDYAWNAIADVLHPIVAGQSWDVHYFGIEKNKQMKSADDLEHYCYQVAGSVGEFWGIVGKKAYSMFSELSEIELKEIGCHYGKGLQLVNVLRDLPTDIKNGRCYIPEVNIDNQEHCPVENRKLAGTPKIYKRAKVLNLKFGEKTESWIKDHFSYRSTMIAFYKKINNFIQGRIENSKAMLN